MLNFQGAGDQWSDLETWIQQTPHDKPKFIVSPSMLLPRHRDAARWGHRTSALHSDSWDGYRASLHRILALAATSDTEHVVFLNGDEHVGCLATIVVRYVESGNTIEKTMYSIHTPGLYTPYSFINGSAAKWMPETDHEFEVGGQKFEYTVAYTPFEGEGFAYLNVDRTAGAWNLTCQFADGPVQTVF